MTASPSTHRATDSREATGLSAPRLVLASGSASRLRVLRTAGIYAEALPSGVPEDVDGADTEAAVTVVAERKARAWPPGAREHWSWAATLCSTLTDLLSASPPRRATPSGCGGFWWADRPCCIRATA